MQIQSGNRQVVGESGPEPGSKTVDMSSFLEEVALGRININSIQNGLLHVSAPLKAGVYLFPGKYEDARVVVQAGTMAWLTIELAKSPSQKTVMSKISVQMSRPVTVTNPSSAYEEPGCSNGLKDLFADVLIKGIEVGTSGEILFQGTLKKGFSCVDIKEAFKPEMFPKIDLKLESLLNKKKKPAEPLPPVGFSPKISLTEMLTKLGAVVGEAKCSVQLHTDAPVVKIPHAGIEVESCSSKADIHMHVSARLRPGGCLEINSDEYFENVLELAHSRLQFGANLTVAGLGEKKPKVDGALRGVLNIAQPAQFVVLAGEHTRVPFSVGGERNRARFSVDLRQNRPQNLKLDYFLEGHLAESSPIQLGDCTAQFEEAKLQLWGSHPRNHARLTVSRPNLGWDSLRAKMNGRVEVEVSHEQNSKGSILYRISPDNLRQFERRVVYEFFPGPELALRPASSGVSQFLDPENQFVWAPSRIADPSAPCLGELGSQKWRSQIEPITGAPIRSDNRVKLLIDGIMSFEERMKLIQGAKHSIYLQSLLMKDDPTGMATAEALVQAKRRGVAVYILLDAVGSLESMDNLVRENKAYQILRENDIPLQIYGNRSIRGFSKIAEVVVRNPILQGFNGIEDFLNPKDTLSTCNLMARASLGELELGLSGADQAQIHEGLKLIFGDNDAALQMIKRLAHVDASQPFELSEVIRVFEQVLSLNHRLHEKYLIVDGQQAVLGGMNIADEYAKGGLQERVRAAGTSRLAWRDTDILIEGPAVSDASTYFIRNWKALSGEALALLPSQPHQGGVDVQVIQSLPGADLEHPITNLKIEAIKSLKAGDKLYEASAYFIPRGALKPYAQALILAAERGVDVRILTNSQESTDLPVVNRAAISSCYPELLAGKVRIFERTGDRTMHQKVAAYGSKLGLVGSYNLGNRSASLNSENLAVVYSEDFTRQMEAMLLDDMRPEVAREVRLEDTRSFPIETAILNSASTMLEDQM